MQFDKLVHIVLKESDELPGAGIVPAFDGQPEIYLTSLRAFYDDDDNDGERIVSLRYTAVHRSDDWNMPCDDYLLYKGNSYEDAYKALVTGLREESFVGKNFLSKQVSRFKDLIGEFRVSYFNDGDQPPEFTFACKLDPSWLRSNQINKGLQGVDTTGFEDLL